MQLEFEKELSALIPVYDPSYKTIYDKVALVGDAAAQVKATSGGGLAIGGFCSRIAGQIIGRGMPLKDYERTWRKEFGSELNIHLQIHNHLNRLSDDDLNEFLAMVKEEGLVHLVEKYGDMERPGKLLNELMRQPGLMMKFAKFFF